MSGFRQYIEYLQNDGGDELIAMMDLISTNLTGFFRESGHFDYFSEVILPEIVSRAAGRGRRLRIWSAGCSSGEEPYTIAILVNEGLPEVQSWDAKLLATDLSTKVLGHAMRGIYRAEQLASVPGMLLARYFVCVQTRPERLYKVGDSWRRLVHFGRLNLMEAWPVRGPFDVIFCRNVMIYFDKATQGRLIGRFWDLLAPGGMLFVGHSESLADVKHKFEYVQPTVYRRG
jgi:chemotaxis protein methyltransferase CheR